MPFPFPSLSLSLPFPYCACISHPSKLPNPALSSPLKRLCGSLLSFSAKSTMREGGATTMPGDVERRVALAWIWVRMVEKK